ncbi:MAG TPA: hypothetical protein VGC76_01720 [Pyrinomonadaceae bacterium]|jgi:DNA-directed RNA polymerase specialized sigma24 family protein
MTNTSPENKNEITQAAFDKLLSALDASDREQAGALYVELRENLRRFFTWRGSSFPEDAADETLTRTAKRLEGGEQIADFRAYVFGIARFLILETSRREAKARLALAELPESKANDEETNYKQARLDCLEKCLRELETDERIFIVDYYKGERAAKIKHRQILLEKLKLSSSGLRMKALRLRERLENCLQNCLSERGV